MLQMTNTKKYQYQKLEQHLTADIHY